MVLETPLSSRCLHRILFLCSLTWWFVLAGGVLYGGEKTDRVGLLNGDKLTGEVKKLEDGLLVLSTDDMGTLSIEWDKISSLISSKQFEVEMSDGTLHYGLLSDTSTPRFMLITTDSLIVRVYRDEVVKLIPMDDEFWTRLDGSLSLGFSYTMASGLFQLNSNMDVTYRGRKSQSELTFSSVLTRQTDVENSGRFDLVFSSSPGIPRPAWRGRSSPTSCSS